MIVQWLLEKGDDVNTHGGPSGTALQEASENVHYQIVQQLLENGADVNDLNGYGTPLQEATKLANDQIFELLLEKGADVNRWHRGAAATSLYSGCSRRGLMSTFGEDNTAPRYRRLQKRATARSSSCYSRMGLLLWFAANATSTKVLAKQKQRDKSTATIAIKKRTAAIDSRRRINPGASVPAPARPQEVGAHRNPHNGVGSNKGLAENSTDTTHQPMSK
jgi:hypothetical protein